MADASKKGDPLTSLEDLLRQRLDREGWDAFAWFPTEHEMARGETGRAVSPESLRPRPDANSKLLMNAAGTVWLVIGGVAYAYTSDGVFRQVQYRCHYRWVGTNPRARMRICPRFHAWGDYSDIQTAIMDPFCSLRVSPINQAVYLIRSGMRHGITSARAFDNYQFDWDDVKPWDLSVELWHRLEEGVLLTEERGGRFD